MDIERLMDVLPHYAAMLVLMFLVLAVVRQIFGGVEFWIELVIVVAVVMTYHYGVKFLGIAPEAWEEDRIV